MPEGWYAPKGVLRERLWGLREGSRHLRRQHRVASRLPGAGNPAITGQVLAEGTPAERGRPSRRDLA